MTQPCVGFRFLFRVVCLGLVTCCVFTTQAGAPSGFEDIIKGIEPGKRFHALWPPPTGQTVLGLLVEAKNANSPQAIFENIESPDFGTFQGKFTAGYLDYAAPELTDDKNVDVDVTFSQLDAIASQLGKASGQKQGSDSSNKSKRTSTGFDYSSVKNCTRKASNIRVEYYTLVTLLAITDGSLVNAKAQSFLTKQQKGWMIHRALRVDGLEYSLTTDKGFDAGFFAALVKWIPGVGVSWKDKKTIKLNMKQPIYIGYKLWRPGEDIRGAAFEDIDVMTLGIGDAEIDKEASAARGSQ